MRALLVRIKQCRTGWQHRAGDTVVVKAAAGACHYTGQDQPPLGLWEVVLPTCYEGDCFPQCDAEPIRKVTAAEMSFGDEFFDACFERPKWGHDPDDALFD